MWTFWPQKKTCRYYKKNNKIWVKQRPELVWRVKPTILRGDAIQRHAMCSIFIITHSHPNDKIPQDSKFPIIPANFSLLFSSRFPDSESTSHSPSPICEFQLSQKRCLSATTMEPRYSTGPTAMARPRSSSLLVSCYTFNLAQVNFFLSGLCSFESFLNFCHLGRWFVGRSTVRIGGDTRFLGSADIGFDGNGEAEWWRGWGELWWWWRNSSLRVW